MGRVRIISNRVVRPGRVLTRGELYDAPDLELQLLVRMGSAEWVEDASAAVEESEPEEAAEVPEQPEAVAFASSSAEKLAGAAGLTATDFAGLEPSGKTGFTKADVEAVIARGEP